MLLKDPQRMAELFGLLLKDPSARYQDKELNEALNNALFLEDDVLYGRYYWYTKFLCRYEAAYGKNGRMEQARF